VRATRQTVSRAAKRIAPRGRLAAAECFASDDLWFGSRSYGLSKRGAGAPARKESRMGQPIVHFEVVGSDGDKLKAYYAELFGWSSRMRPGR
jgi:hypothetical protein